MEEIWRVLGAGGRVHVSVPYYNAHCAATDPTHVSSFSENTFDYFTPDGEAAYSEYNYYTRARFHIVSIRPVQRKWLFRLPCQVQWFLAHHLATVHGLEVELSAVKEDPGVGT